LKASCETSSTSHSSVSRSRIRQAGFASVISAAAAAASTTISPTTARNTLSKLGTP